MANIKPILDGAKIQLQKQATDALGAAVEDFARGAISKVAGVDIPGRNEFAPPIPGKDWRPTSYATLYSGAVNYRPKLKFLFKVEFLFKPLPQWETFLRQAGISNNEFTFMIKSVDRPKVDFEYDEEVNMYNFRTKVLKRIRHRELTMVFMDDVGNRVFNFFRLMLAIQQPITRRSVLPAGSNKNISDGSYQTPASGMTFTTGLPNSLSDYAHRGVVNTDVGSVIQKIRIRQIFVDPSIKDINSATKEVYFDFLNPRVISFDLDDLTHDTSDVNLLTMQFDYDWMEMGEGDKTGLKEDPKPFNPAAGSASSPSDLTVPKRGGTAGGGGGLGDAFGNILSSAVSNAAQKVVSGAVGKALKGLPGGLGSQVGNAIGGMVGNATNQLVTGPINSVTNTAVNYGTNAVNSVTSALKQSFNAGGSNVGSGTPGTGP